MSTTSTTPPTSEASGSPLHSRTSHSSTSAPVATDSRGNDLAVYRVAAQAAFLALAALVVGGTAMSMTARTGTETADVLAAISTNPWPYVAGGVGLVLVSLFDIFTIPALHAALGRHGRALIVLASATAVIGDLLGIIGRLAQTAMVPLGLQAGNSTGGIGGAGSTGGTGSTVLAAGQVLEVLDTTINTAGFVLVSVSFTCFGLLMLRGFSRRIGWVAIVAGVFTLLGQIPALAPLFIVANVAYVAWYVAIGRRFWRMAHQHRGRSATP